LPKFQEKSAFEEMSRDDLLRALEMFAKNWLAHDGCWFLAAEERFGMENAIDLDARSWKRFAEVEARRIMTTFRNLCGDGGSAYSHDMLTLSSGRRSWAILCSGVHNRVTAFGPGTRKNSGSLLSDVARSSCNFATFFVCDFSPIKVLVAHAMEYHSRLP
jgi:hypothetical protein